MSRFDINRLRNFEQLLTTQELTLFDNVLGSLKDKKTIARVAGGWVRDKLLGHISDDIDIAVDDQTGEQFARGVNNYLITTQGQTSVTVSVIQVFNSTHF